MKQNRWFGRRREGDLNRSRILNEILKAELQKTPLTFGKLKEKVGLSGKTLTKHLNDLKDESLVKREIQGKYIVYKVVTGQTVLEMRKDLHEELNRLFWVYWDCLNKETGRLFNLATDSLKKSIDESDPMSTLKIVGKTYPIPKHKTTEKVTITQDEDKFKKPKVEIESKFRSRKGRRKK